ncbi:MAG: PH domain-containing protein [Niastella sp.]|nr:PH domain-containing protein [Niastella sp.]
MNMNPLPENSWSTPQRQAKAGLLIILFKAAVTIIKTVWPLLVLLLVKENKKGMDHYEIAVIALPAIILVSSLVNYYYFRFFIANEELIIRKGFISKKTITIPLQKIQTVHIEQNLLHQLANVAKVKIDTAGSEKTEAVIDAIEVRKAEQLKEFLLREKQVTTAEETASRLPARDTPVMHLSFGDLLKLGLSANHIQAFFIVLAFSITQLQNLGEIFGDRVYKAVRDSSSTVGVSVTSVSLVVAFVLFISVLVSMMRILLNYFDFQLTETSQGYKVKAGLINTRQNLIPFSKIQYISWEANWIRRKIGLYNMEFHQVMSDDQNNKKQRVKVPLTQLGYIDKLLAHYHALVQPLAAADYGIHTAYTARRTLLIGVIPVAILLTVLLLIKWNPWLLLITLWIPVIALHAFVFRRNFRLYVAPDALQVNSGIWGRKTQIVRWYKTQQVFLEQSIYQRRKELATIYLYTAGGKITIPYIPLKLAQQIQDYALYEVERTEQAWM